MSTCIDSKNGIRFVYISANSYYDLGFQHGQLLKEDIESFLNAFKKYIRLKMGYKRGIVLEKLVSTLSPFLSSKLSPDNREEIKGIAEGSGQSISWVYALNFLYEFGAVFNKNIHFLGCSSFIVSTNEGLLIGKTTDVIEDEYVSKLVTEKRTIFVYKIKAKNTKFLTGSFPAMICGDWGITKSGVFFGFNDGGLETKRNFFQNKSVMTSIRWLLESTKNVPEAIEKTKTIKLIRPYIAIISDGLPENSYSVNIMPKGLEWTSFDNNLVETNLLKNKSDCDYYYSKKYQLENSFYQVANKRYQVLKKNIDKVKNCQDAIFLIGRHTPDFSMFSGSVSSKATDQGVVYYPLKKTIYLPDGNIVPVTYHGTWHEFKLKDLFDKLDS